MSLLVKDFIDDAMSLEMISREADQSTAFALDAGHHSEDCFAELTRIFTSFLLTCNVFNIKGVLAPVFTPMDDAGNVNLEVIQDYMEYLNREKVRGILVGGTTGEAALLNLSERRALLEAWVKAAKPLGVQVISQVGGAPIPDVTALAKYSEKVGADAIMTLPELYYKPKTVEQLVGYLEIVSMAAPTLPLIYYHFPMMSGVDVHIKEFFSVASNRISAFKGMKADLGVAVQVADQLASDQRVFIANHHLATSVLMGHDSSIATVTNMFPDLVLGIVDAVQRGDVTLARSQQEKMNRIVDSISRHGDFVPSMKAAMQLLTGVKVGPPRKPLTCLRETDILDLEHQLKALNLL